MQARSREPREILAHQPDETVALVSHQGPETLRWALYEAAKVSSRPSAPDHAYYASVKQHHDGKLAAIAMARKLVRRCYHTLRAVDGEEVYAIP